MVVALWTKKVSTQRHGKFSIGAVEAITRSVPSKQARASIRWEVVFRFAKTRAELGGKEIKGRNSRPA